MKYKYLVNVLRRNSAIKTATSHYGYKDLRYGFFGNPVSQAVKPLAKRTWFRWARDHLPVVEVARKRGHIVK